MRTWTLGLPEMEDKLKIQVEAEKLSSAKVMGWGNALK
jgi:hypothetical protein